MVFEPEIADRGPGLSASAGLADEVIRHPVGIGRQRLAQRDGLVEALQRAVSRLFDAGEESLDGDPVRATTLSCRRDDDNLRLSVGGPARLEHRLPGALGARGWLRGALVRSRSAWSRTAASRNACGVGPVELCGHSAAFRARCVWLACKSPLGQQNPLFTTCRRHCPGQIVYSMCRRGAPSWELSMACAVRLPVPLTTTAIAFPLAQPLRLTISWMTVWRSGVCWSTSRSPTTVQSRGVHDTAAVVSGHEETSFVAVV